MARLKFFVFALAALGLWGYHLTQVAPLAISNSTDAAQAAVTGAAGPVAVALEAQKSLTQTVAFKVATSNAVLLPAPKPKPEAPAGDRFTAVRTAAADGLSPEQAEALFVAVTNEAGTLWAKGGLDPVAEVPEGLDLAGVMAGGSAGGTRSIDGADYLLLTAPLLYSDKNEVRSGGSVIVGLPVLPAVAALEQARGALKLTSLALLADGKPVLVAGEKTEAEKIVATLKAGAMGALESGPVKQVGPLQLPLPQLTPDLTWSIGARQKVAGTNFEVAASAPSKAQIEALANYEFFAVAAFGGLLFATLVWLLIMGGKKDDAPAMVKPVMPAPPKRDEQATVSSPVPEAPVAAPEASPDDFDFPASSSGMSASAPPPPVAMTGEAPAYVPAEDPFASIPEPPAPPPPPMPAPSVTMDAPALQRANPASLFDDEDNQQQRTVAYPVSTRSAVTAPPPPPVSDPFALAAAQEAPSSNEEEPNPDATRVAAIPSELLNASRAPSGSTMERPAFRPPTGAMPKVASIPPPGGASDEERHFQEVFRDFVSTREKCREPADGLTYDKFKAKLLKNKEQLVAKYQCKTVRFQVYVKDGKAALKATPVKD